jgi:hypothetical protein
VGGFALIDAPSKEAAVAYVKDFLRIMGQGECELRQLFDANGPGQSVSDQSEEVAAH